MVQSIDGYGRILTTEEVEVEEILPRLSAQRPRFDLHQIQVAQCECAQCAEESAGNVSRAEHQRGLPLRSGGRADRMIFRVLRRTKQEESREILPVAFN